MVLRDVDPKPSSAKALKGTVWEAVSKLGAPRDDTVYSSILDIISQARQTLAPGATIDVEVKGDYRVSSLVIDVARDVQADFYLNDDTAPRWSTRDRLGFGGQFTLGDTRGASVMRVKRVRIVATNQHSTEQRDVRAWMVVQ